MPTRLPNSTTTLYQQPDGTYQITASGVSGETPTTVYVTDLVCTDDLDANGAETTSDLQAFAQDIYHLMIEAFGSNLADPTGGLGLNSLLSGSAQDAKAVLATVDPMIRQDPRTDQSTTTATYDGAGNLTGAQIVVLPVGSLLPIQFSWAPVSGLQRVQ